MISSNNKISLRQLQILLIIVLFSNNSLILPNKTAKVLEQNGWMLIISGSILVIGFLYLIIKLAELFPEESIVDYAPKVITPALSYLVSIGFLFFLICISAFELRLFGELVKQTLLRETPLEFVIISMLFVVVYINRKGIEARARLGEIIIFIAFVPIIMVMLLAVKDVDISNLAPIIDVDIGKFVTGTYFIGMLFGGVDLVLLAYPYLNSKKNVFKGLVQSVCFVAGASLVTNIITLGIFGAKETASQVWPVMTIMQVIKMPGDLVERQDALMMSFWILSVFAMLNAYVYYGAFITARLCKSNETGYFNLILVPIIYIVSLLPDNIVQISNSLDFVLRYVNIIFLFIVPLFIFLVAKIRKKGGNYNES